MQLSILEVGILTIIVGFILVILGVLIHVLSWVRQGVKGELRGGGAIIIGPFPLAFGTDKEMIKLAIILTLIAVTAFIVIQLIINFYP